MEFCLQPGHNGAATEVGKKQMKSLLDVTNHIVDFFSQTNKNFVALRKIEGKYIPGGTGCIDFTRHKTGECLLLLDGKPVAFVTRLHSTQGCDANLAKFYRKQWYFENYLKKLNPNCTHVTFIYANETLLETFKKGVSMAMSQDFNTKSFNEYNHGGNCIFCYDTDKGTDTWYDMQEKLIQVVRYNLNKIAESKKKAQQTDEGQTMTG